MKQQSGWFRVTGARGSLPLWIEIAQGILEHENYDKKLDRISLNIDPESSLIFTDKLSGEKRMLDSESGLPDDNGSVTVTIPAQSGIHIPD
jgi:hypothetical protein